MSRAVDQTGCPVSRGGQAGFRPRIVKMSPGPGRRVPPAYIGFWRCIAQRLPPRKQ
ncbi:MAG: hypothetical protein QOF15_4597 [Mycobacterium sp.]|jgi:hypothetical protein|nr:hypothetical protein [Mycobacterium sp.]